MKSIIVITITLGFIWLSHYAYTHKPEEAGYTHSAFDILDKGAPKHRTKRELLQAQAAAYADLYHLTPEDAAKPVKLWEENR